MKPKACSLFPASLFLCSTLASQPPACALGLQRGRGRAAQKFLHTCWRYIPQPGARGREAASALPIGSAVAAGAHRTPGSVVVGSLRVAGTGGAEPQPRVRRAGGCRRGRAGVRCRQVPFGAVSRWRGRVSCGREPGLGSGQVSDLRSLCRFIEREPAASSLWWASLVVVALKSDKLLLRCWLPPVLRL